MSGVWPPLVGRKRKWPISDDDSESSHGSESDGIEAPAEDESDGDEAPVEDEDECGADVLNEDDGNDGAGLPTTLHVGVGIGAEQSGRVSRLRLGMAALVEAALGGVSVLAKIVMEYTDTLHLMVICDEASRGRPHRFPVLLRLFHTDTQRLLHSVKQEGCLGSFLVPGLPLLFIRPDWSDPAFAGRVSVFNVCTGLKTHMQTRISHCISDKTKDRYTLDAIGGKRTENNDQPGTADLWLLTVDCEANGEGKGAPTHLWFGRLQPADSFVPPSFDDLPSAEKNTKTESDATDLGEAFVLPVMSQLAQMDLRCCRKVTRVTLCMADVLGRFWVVYVEQNFDDQSRFRVYVWCVPPTDPARRRHTIVNVQMHRAEHCRDSSGVARLTHAASSTAGQLELCAVRLWLGAGSSLTMVGLNTADHGIEQVEMQDTSFVGWIVDNMIDASIDNAVLVKLRPHGASSPAQSMWQCVQAAHPHRVAFAHAEEGGALKALWPAPYPDRYANSHRILTATSNEVYRQCTAPNYRFTVERDQLDHNDNESRRQILLNNNESPRISEFIQLFVL